MGMRDKAEEGFQDRNLNSYKQAFTGDPSPLPGCSPARCLSTPHLALSGPALGTPAPPGPWRFRYWSWAPLPPTGGHPSALGTSFSGGSDGRGQGPFPAGARGCKELKLDHGLQASQVPCGSLAGGRSRPFRPQPRECVRRVYACWQREATRPKERHYCHPSDRWGD